MLVRQLSYHHTSVTDEIAVRAVSLPYFYHGLTNHLTYVHTLWATNINGSLEFPTLVLQELLFGPFQTNWTCLLPTSTYLVGGGFTRHCFCCFQTSKLMGVIGPASLQSVRIDCNLFGRLKWREAVNAPSDDQNFAKFSHRATDSGDEYIHLRPVSVSYDMYYCLTL